MVIAAICTSLLRRQSSHLNICKLAHINALKGVEPTVLHCIIKHISPEYPTIIHSNISQLETASLKHKESTLSIGETELIFTALA